jgi:gamma-glutamylcyclotransferase (GGCT)/AIG2-like uncharacterized protein YtfP
MDTGQLPAGTDATAHLFAYGSLVDPKRLDSVLGHRHLGERLSARLEGFERITDRYAYPFIVAAPGKRVDGVVLMDLSPADLHALDLYEDVTAGLYVRQKVDVSAWGCGPRSYSIPAHTYVAGPSLARLVGPASR